MRINDKIWFVWGGGAMKKLAPVLGSGFYLGFRMEPGLKMRDETNFNPRNETETGVPFSPVLFGGSN